MFEKLWTATLIAFALALVPALAHAIISLSFRQLGREERPKWLIWLKRATQLILALAFGVLTGCIIAKWVEGGYPPFSNMPESLMWMAWSVCLIYFFVAIKISLPGMELAVAFGALLILAAAALHDHTPRPLMPALQSNWLIFHVMTCMMSYGAFFVAFCMAIMWFIVWRRTEASKMVDALTYHTMAFGTLLLTIGIISGAVWAQRAWGRYWGWDPKETWSLITWFVYAIFLHFRLIAGSFGIKRERLPALNAAFALVGFGATLFTYFGVSYLLPSLHSYISR